MHWNSFGRSVGFAALAAVAAALWLALARPLLGGQVAVATCLVGTAAAYLGGLAPKPGRRVAVLVVTAFLACAIALATRTLTELAFGLTILIAGVRSGFLYRPPLARAVVVETIFAGGGLLFARFLAGGSVMPLALAVWGFLLVQSTYFLVGGVHPRQAPDPHPDPFDQVYSRAVALLDQPVVSRR